MRFEASFTDGRREVGGGGCGCVGGRTRVGRDDERSREGGGEEVVEVLEVVGKTPAAAFERRPVSRSLVPEGVLNGRDG